MLIKNISVVIIVKNSENTIKRTLNSLVDFCEVIVYDNFINFNDTELENFYNTIGFALGLDDLKFIQDYFKSEKIFRTF